MPEGTLFQIGNLKFDARLLSIYAVVAAVMILALILAQMYWRRRLTKWAESQQLQLVSFRGAWFFERPSAWTRSRNQHVFRVITKDRDGLTRYCWIMFGTFWASRGASPSPKWSGATPTIKLDCATMKIYLPVDTPRYLTPGANHVR